MKHSFLSVLAISTLLLAWSCSKSDKPEKENTKPLVTVPDAIVANDGKSGGVYKGVIIGSTGTVKIILQGNTVSAEVTIDGETKVLAPQNIPVGWASGQPLKEIVFAANNWTLTFSVGASGDHPYISSISIPGHTDVAVHIVKEQSTTLARVFEGTFGKTDTALLGTINFVVTSEYDSVQGIMQRQVRPKVQTSGNYHVGAEEYISLHTYSGTVGEEFSALGELKGNEIEGKWKIYHNISGHISDSGYWKAKRTL